MEQEHVDRLLELTPHRLSAIWACVAATRRMTKDQEALCVAVSECPALAELLHKLHNEHQDEKTASLITNELILLRRN